MIARIAPRMPGREVVDEHLEAARDALSEEVVELLDEPAADRPEDHRAEEHRDASEPMMMPIVATTPTTPPRWPYTSLPPV